MPDITSNVSFDKVAREWRCKWSPDTEKASLTAAQALIDEYLGALKGLDGVVGVQRVVCGDCLDFKVVTQLEEPKFGAWEANKFAPEEEFLSKLSAIEGVTGVETQTYTLMSL